MRPRVPHAMHMRRRPTLTSRESPAYWPSPRASGADGAPQSSPQNSAKLASEGRLRVRHAGVGQVPPPPPPPLLLSPAPGGGTARSRNSGQGLGAVLDVTLGPPKEIVRNCIHLSTAGWMRRSKGLLVAPHSSGDDLHRMYRPNGNPKILKELQAHLKTYTAPGTYIEVEIRNYLGPSSPCTTDLPSHYIHPLRK